jgi:hypothetical protein
MPSTIAHVPIVTQSASVRDGRRRRARWLRSWPSRPRRPAHGGTTDPLVACVRRPLARRAQRRRTTREAVGDARVGPADHAVAEGDRDPDVDGGERVGRAGGRAAAQVDGRHREQEHVDLLLGPDAPDAELEAERLYGVVEGLTLHAVLRPER